MKEKGKVISMIPLSNGIKLLISEKTPSQFVNWMSQAVKNQFVRWMSEADMKRLCDEK